MTPKAGQIVLIPFPFSDLNRHKKRPVLVLTPPDQYGDFIALAITSQQTRAPSNPITTADLVEGHLPKSSYVRTDKVFTLSTSLVLKALGNLQPALLHKAIERLCQKISS